MVTKRQKANLKRLCKKPISKITRQGDAEVYIKVCKRTKKTKAKAKRFFVRKFGFI